MGRFGVKTPKRKRSADILIFLGGKNAVNVTTAGGFSPYTALQWHDVVPPPRKKTVPAFRSNIYNIEINFVERENVYPGNKRDVSFN
jgi:hypothetical protein